MAKNLSQHQIKLVGSLFKRLNHLHQVNPSPFLSLSISTGKKKTINEDCIGVIENKTSNTMAILDGHWGIEAAKIGLHHCLSLSSKYPKTKSEAQKSIQRLENQLFKIFGNNKMYPNKDFTPETSLLAVNINQNNLFLINFGDCFGFLVRNGSIKMLNKPIATWLGAFSKLKLRQRSSAFESTEFRKIKLHKKDIILLMTDGITECIYEKPTISPQMLLQLCSMGKTPMKICSLITKKALKLGGEDNLACIVYQHS